MKNAQELFELFTSLTQQGRAVCTWEELPPLVRDAWEAVRKEVIDEERCFDTPGENR